MAERQLYMCVGAIILLLNLHVWVCFSPSPHPFRGMYLDLVPGWGEFDSAIRHRKTHLVECLGQQTL